MLRTLRLALKKHTDGDWDLDDICDRVESITGDRPARGTISAVENGNRGVSAELLTALEQAYGLERGSITTEYQPRSTPAAAEDVA
jgi:transcriptional regulator with XRE-family HTH domain